VDRAWRFNSSHGADWGGRQDVGQAELAEATKCGMNCARSIVSSGDSMKTQHRGTKTGKKHADVRHFCLEDRSTPHTNVHLETVLVLAGEGSQNRIQGRRGWPAVVIATAHTLATTEVSGGGSPEGKGCERGSDTRLFSKRGWGGSREGWLGISTICDAKKRKPN